MKAVEFVPGEPFRARVASRTRAGRRHFVDLQAMEWNGVCDCEDFQCNRVKAIKRKGLRKTATRCWHILAARNAWFDEFGPLLAFILDTDRNGKQLRLWVEAARLCVRLHSPLQRTAMGKDEA